MGAARGFKHLITATVLLGSSAAHAYKTSLDAVHFGPSLGGAYASQISSDGSWDLVPGLVPNGSTYSNAATYKTPLRIGFFYRHPQFTVDTYLRYFANYNSEWHLGGTGAGQGNSRYKGIGLGIDFEMPIYLSPWLRAGLAINAEYVKNRVLITFTPDSGPGQSLEAGSNNALFGGGAFVDLYLGDLWSLGLRGLYAYDLGGTWRARKAGALFGSSHAKDAAITTLAGDPATSSFSHWRAEMLLRLAFY